MEHFPQNNQIEALPNAVWCLQIDPIYIVEFNSRRNRSLRQHFLRLLSPFQDLQIER